MARKLKVILFGAGLVGRQILPVYRDKVDIIGFADNDPKKQERSVLGVPVMQPDTILNHQYDYVVISSTSVGQIMDQLISLGVPRERIRVIREAESGENRHFPWDALLFLVIGLAVTVGILFYGFKTFLGS